MTGRRFPNSPKFSGEQFADGANPFAEPSETSAGEPANSADKNLFAASSVDDHPDVPADVYERGLPSRGMLVLRLGTIGLGLAVLSLLWVLVTIAMGINNSIISLPTSYLSLIAAIPACYFGSADLSAMRAGAMEESGNRDTRRGFWMGVAGLVIGLLPTVLGTAAFVMYLLA